MIVLGISGKKQAGKTTVGNFILALYLAKLEYSHKILMDTEDGNILISDLLGDDRYEGSFNIHNIIQKFHDPRAIQAIETLHKKVKIYNFADVLKQDICINILGLTYEQCYGTDDQKNSLTDIVWSNIPGYSELYNKTANTENNKMTAREVMQIVGTDIFRKIDPNVWIRATINKIITEQPELAVITDCRFPNEIEAIKQIDGKIIRLTRNPHVSEHESENILDKDKYDWSNFDYIVDNTNISLLEQFEQIKTIIQSVTQ